MASSPSTDHNARSVYVGNIDPSVSEVTLQSAFDSEDTKVIKVKIFKNRAIAATSDYGFVEFESHAAAERALQRAAAGMRLEDKELKVNWATSSPSHPNHSGGHSHNSHGNHNANRDHALGKVGANGFYNVFVGDLDGEVGDAALKEAFNTYASLEDAKVMLDSESGASRCFGFVMFREKQDAQNAIVEMQGRQLKSRNLRLNWAHPHPVGRANDGGREGGPMRVRGEGRSVSVWEEKDVKVTTLRPPVPWTTMRS